MSVVTVSIPHRLARDEAKRRIDEGIGGLQQQYGGAFGQLSRIWQGDTMNFNVKIMGMSVPGQVRVEESLVWINITLPAALAMLVGAVRPAIRAGQPEGAGVQIDDRCSATSKWLGGTVWMAGIA